MWIEDAPTAAARAKVLRRMCDLLHIPGRKPLHAICDLDSAVFVGEVIAAIPALGETRLRKLEIMLHGVLATEPAFCVLLGICRLRAEKHEAARRAFAKAIGELELADPSLLEKAHEGLARALIALGKTQLAAPHLARARNGSNPVGVDGGTPPRGLRLLRIGPKSSRAPTLRPARRASATYGNDLVTHTTT